MPLTEKECFDIAITIVKQHQKENLLSTIQRILKKYFPDCPHCLHDINSHEFTENTLPDKELVLESIASRKSLYVAAKNHFLFPVMSLGRVTHVFSLQGQALARQLESLEKIILLFNNQQLLLDNNNHDPLTSLLNRHSFEERLTNIINMQQRRDNEEHSACCFALFDIDFFKRVNDNFGHLYGDEVLILFSNIMETTFRYDDMLFRYGGEEFAVLLKNIDLKTAMPVLNRFKENVAKYQFPQVEHITVSIGVTEITSNTNREQVIQQADKALYFSKENGRNQVNSYEGLLSTGKISEAESHTDDIELF